MSEARTQENRLLAIDTPLGKDKLLLVGFHGAESLGRMFEFELDLISEGSPVDHTKILGQNVTVEMELYQEQTRYFNGYISRFSLVAVDESSSDAKKIYTYRATLVPHLWFLTRVADCRIFQSMTVLDIVKSLLKEKGYTDIKESISGSYRTWEYCVQYRETDFNFISRLLENEGIYYYFEHDKTKHTMVLCDSPSAHQPASNYDSLKFDEPDFESGTDAFLWDWNLGYEITPNQYAMTDYDFTQPQTDLSKVVNIEHPDDMGTYEVFDYPGGYTVAGDGRNYTKTRLEEAEVKYAIGHGTSSARGIFAGATFKLEDHPTEADEYLIISMNYQVRGDEMGAGLGKGSGGGGSYLCQVTCMPKAYDFRPARTTPKPVVQGPQTAKITGPKGEEIYCDKYGRVKCQFYWDRLGKNDENSSCWIRVSQNYAGKSWGAIDMPRIGQEVIVEFLEGDPDRPIITGRVYNGANMPPYKLPDKKMVSGMKSNSTPGGGGYNEMSMDDTKGSEMITVHGQKDMSTTIENDQTDTVKHNRTATVTNDDSETVNGNQSVTIAKDQSVTISGNQTQNISKKQTESISSDQSLTVGGKQTAQISSDQSITVGGKRTDNVTGNESVSIGGSQSTTVGSSQTVNVSQSLTINAGTAITLQVGGSSIKISMSGIEIVSSAPVKVTGAMVQVNS